MSHTRSAFTLIELLVVIAIIAILAAILFPVFAQARESARKSTCLSNMKQIGNALMMYTQDYDETYPQSEYGGNGFGPQQQWYVMVYPYVKNGDHYVDQGVSYSWGNDGIYRCPSHPDDTQGQQFGLHMDIFPSNYGGGKTNTVGMAAVDAPASKVYLVEKGRLGQTWSVPYYDSDEWDNTSGVWYDKATNTARHDNTDVQLLREGDNMRNDDSNWWGHGGMLPRYRHANSTNCLFGDGHAKSFARGQMKWFENIFVPVNRAAGWISEGWYPY